MLFVCSAIILFFNFGVCKFVLVELVDYAFSVRNACNIEVEDWNDVAYDRESTKSVLFFIF